MRYIELVGPCHISVVEFNAETGTEFRRSILPGRYTDGVWVDTDISAEADDVKAFALAAWTTEAVDAFKIATTPGDIEPLTHLNNGGLVRFLGALPCTVYENIRIAGVTRVSKGRYRVVHETPMPSDQYSAFPSVFDALPRVIRVTARTAAYVELRVTDLAGVVQDPTEVSVQTERVVTT